MKLLQGVLKYIEGLGKLYANVHSVLYACKQGMHERFCMGTSMCVECIHGLEERTHQDV